MAHETPKELADAIRSQAGDYPPHLYGGIGHLLRDIAKRIDALAGTADPVASQTPRERAEKALTTATRIAAQIYVEMSTAAKMDGVTFDDEQAGFVKQALSDAVLETLRASPVSEAHSPPRVKHKGECIYWDDQSVGACDCGAGAGPYGIPVAPVSEAGEADLSKEQK